MSKGSDTNTVSASPSVKFQNPYSDILSVATDEVNSEFNQYMDYYADMLKAEDAKKVIIIEDDPFSQRILENSILQFNPQLRCFHASSEQEVTNILERVRCDLVISDFFLEGAKTGLDICDRLHEDYPDTKCLIVSQLSFAQYHEIAQRSHSPPGFISKPVSLRAINQCLTDIFKEDHHVAR